MMTQLFGQALALLLLGQVTGAQAAATGAIEGCVRQTGTRMQIEGAVVEVDGTELGASTNDTGLFRIDKVPAGEFRVSVSAVGFSSKTRSGVRVAPGRITRLDFRLAFEPPRVSDRHSAPRLLSSDDSLDALFPVVVRGKCGYIDRKGRLVIKPQYVVGHGFRNGRAWVNVGGTRAEGDFRFGSPPEVRGGRWGMIDRSGRFVLDPQFREVEDFSEGLAMVEFGTKYGFIDRAGRLVAPPQFDDADMVFDDMARVEISGKVGFLDTMGGWAIKPELADAFELSEGFFGAKERGKWSLRDRTGRLRAGPFDEMGTFFSAGRAMVRIGRKCGYIDTSGRTVIRPRFDAASPFRDGLARVRVGNKFGFVDTAGRLVIPLVYDVLLPSRASSPA